jgi:hypothetical protein
MQIKQLFENSGKLFIMNDAFSAAQVTERRMGRSLHEL